MEEKPAALKVTPRLAAIVGGAALGIAILVLLVGQLTGMVRFGSSGAGSARLMDSDVRKFSLICKVHIRRPKEGIEAPAETEDTVLQAGFDLDEQSGWYEGEYTISASRKGSLHVNGDVLEAGRPAMFKRYGISITGERFSVDRSTGKFRQWVLIGDGKRLDLIDGVCKRVINAPF